ncbi:MAG TPA: radical SAM protein [Candidatus Aphodousia gallistercoris]|nr:radical SAM protein [Candidatus Aphodousia gallistercoris]
MTTILHASPVFGPVKSRRLGVSLGVNLLPGSGKVCTFDCIYCECGLNDERKTSEKLPSAEFVISELEKRLQLMASQGQGPDVITFAGNGEPTAHPDFGVIINETIRLRDLYFPKAKISVLSNGTQVHKPSVFDALLKVDNNILKLDTVNEAYIARVNRPSSHYRVAKQIEAFKRFNGQLIIQTMFLKGYDLSGQSVDNTTDEYVLPWLAAIKEIAPREVMVYTIDRETPDSSLQKASRQELDRIGQLVRQQNVAVQISY